MYCMHFVQSSLDMMYSCTSLLIVVALVLATLTCRSCFLDQLLLFSLHTMHQGVDFVIGASSTDVVSKGSSFIFVCFCKGVHCTSHPCHPSPPWTGHIWFQIHAIASLMSGSVRKTLKLNSLFFFIYFHPREPKCDSKHSQTDHGNIISHTCNYSIVYHACMRASP